MLFDDFAAKHPPRVDMMEGFIEVSYRHERQHGAENFSKVDEPMHISSDACSLLAHQGVSCLDIGNQSWWDVFFSFLRLLGATNDDSAFGAFE
jgi:hypothetical protein